MIRVTAKPEPTNFNAKVRLPGAQFLKNCPAPSTEEFKSRKAEFWKESTTDLYAAYQQVCAYTGIRFLERKRATVDHFLPKSKYPSLAYEWSNFRLSTWLVNSHKGASDRIIDPFEVELGWFSLDFPSCLVRPGPTAPSALLGRIEETIDTLKLNDHDEWVQDRCDHMVWFSKEDVTLAFLDEVRPFLATEVKRQQITPSQAALLFRGAN